VKKIKILLLAICCLVVMPFECLASSANINVTGTSTAVVGNKVTVTVTLSSSTKIGSWQMNLNYDKSYLQLTNSTAEAGGTGIAGYDAKGLNKKTYTFTFKTLKTGSTKVSVGSYLAYDYNTMDEMSLTANSKMIKIITQQELEASYSKDNNLASLDVEGFLLSPSFEKDVTEYAVVVPEDTKSIKISAKARDGKASVSGTGEKEVTSGTNNFEITVRAENGSEKVYKINVEVKDANPINANVDGNLYTVVKIKDYLPSLNTYQDHTILIEDMEIPAYKNDNTGLVLVGLKDSAGEISLFIYDENDGSYKEKGFAIDFMKKDIEEHKVDMIFACGPLPMLKAVRSYAVENNIPLGSKIIFSEDIFDNILSKRIENKEKNNQRQELENKYIQNKYLFHYQAK